MRRLCLTLIAATLLQTAAAEASDSLEKARTIVAGMKPGEWRELPDTRMQDVFPKRERHPAWGVMGPQAVTGAWGGAAFDTKRNIFVVTGGGHTDYGGNEVYQFSLETLRWIRATEPSPMRPVAGRDGQFEVADGSEAPVSSHTYDGLLYLPNVDRVFKFGGAFYRNGYASDVHAYLYDVEHRRWKRGATAPHGGTEIATAYDPERGFALVATETALMAYDAVSDLWREVARDGWDSNRSADFDPVNRRLVLVGPNTAPVVYFGMKPVTVRTVAPVIGDLGFGRGTRPGIAYHIPSQRFAIWNGERDVWAFDARSWHVVRYSDPAGRAPSHLVSQTGRPKSAGIYGRWQYVPALDVFIAYEATADNVWLYKMPPVGSAPATGEDRASMILPRQSGGSADALEGHS